MKDEGRMKKGGRKAESRKLKAEKGWETPERSGG
jgi:hypothetical protein